MLGRPPIYNNFEEMEPKLDAWLSSLVEGEPATVTGLCLALGFESKDTLYAYRDRAEFSYPIKRALLMVEQYYEEALMGKSPTGSIFALKNMGWKDKQEVEQSGGLSINWNEQRSYDIK